MTAVAWLTVPEHVRQVAACRPAGAPGVPRYTRFVLRTEIKNYVPVKTEYGVASRALGDMAAATSVRH